MTAQTVTIDLAALPYSAVLGLARQDIISLRDAAGVILTREGWTPEEVAVVTLPGAKRRMVNGHRNLTLSDADFTAMWNDSNLLLAELGAPANQSEETMRRRAKGLGLGQRTRGRKRATNGR